MNPRAAIGLLVMTLAWAGCQAPPVRLAPEYSGDLIIEGKRIIAAAPSKDKNLWRLRVALAALKAARYNEAKELFDSALPPAGSILLGNAETRQARALFSLESGKVFYGEPYERSMGWFYRGMLYWRDGEPDNARACFRTAQLFDAAAASEDQGDWVLMDYLDGFATAKLGGDGSAALARARKSAMNLPDFDTSANVLIFLQFGYGPVKRTGGDVGEGLVFGEGHSTIQSADIRSGNLSVIAPALDNLTLQASTRGRRQFDTVLADKAAVKKAGDTVGDIGFLPGLILTQPEETRDVGLALLGAGLAGKAFGGTVKPNADTRSWNNLPQHLAFAALRLRPGKQTVKIDFLDANRNQIPALSRQLEIKVNPTRDTVVFVADK